jgi:phosphoribosylaminoimidazole carboxylase (NCAIR synthetase)
MPDFLHRLKTALTGSATTPLVFLGNFEVEDQWAVGEQGLPRVSFSSSSAVVNRMDEFALLLAGPGDHVVLKEAPDPGFLAHLDELGVDLPSVLTTSANDPARSVTQDALDDSALQARLGELAAQGARLLPHGVSVAEERLAELSGLPLAAPLTAVCKAVNSKIYSRVVADELGLRQAPGRTVTTLAELEAAVAWATVLLAEGRSVVAKDAFGVSGKGIVVLEDQRALDRLHTLIRRRAAKLGADRLAILIEEWVAKTTDLNYQLTIAGDGSIAFDFVKEAITERGVHKGHRIPARLTPDQFAAVEKAALLIGERLTADGFHGVVGVDAMLDPEGLVYPVVEINARHNMSTYQVRMQERFLAPHQIALARQYPLKLHGRLPYERLRVTLDGLLLAGGEGLLVTNYATVNAADPGTGPFAGRLYGLLIAEDDDRLLALDEEIEARLTADTQGSQ